METRSANFGPRTEEAFGPGFHHFNIPPESTSSFTALLELPPNQAVELLVHTPPSPPPPPPVPEVCGFSSFSCDVPPPIFPADMELINRATKFSVFATPEKSPENTPESSDNKQVKQEIVDSSPAMSETTFYTTSNKRKDRGKKAKESNKRNKKPVDDGKNGGGRGGDEKLPYVHVRARRGQATDSHSLAERARREKINARMKLLQELVPGCHKISGTASVLDEIINHVQSLQRQVEFLSMRLAAVNPRIDINLDSLMSGENGSLVESNYPGIPMPSVWPEEQIRPQYQQLWQLDGFHHSVWVKEEDNSNFVPP